MKHYVAALLILVLATGLHLRILHAQSLAARRSPTQTTLDIPARIGRYRQIGVDVAVPKATLRVLETSTILIRNYMSPWGRPVQLTIVQAGKTRRSLHFPEVCLVGAGWEVRKQESVPVSILFNAKKLVLVSGDKQEAVLYWFKTGDTLTGNYFVNAMHWARNQFLFGAPSSALIKLTMSMRAGEEDAAFDVLRDFAAKLTPVLKDRVS